MSGPEENIAVELASAGDAAEILALQKLAYLSEAEIYDDYTIPPLKQTLEETLAEFQDQVVLKRSIAGRIVGSVRGYERDGTCFVGKLIVHPDSQNQGIGTQLLLDIEEAFGQAERFELFTGDRSEKNLYLYRKLGYEVFRSKELTDKVTLVFLEKRRRS
jgi:ribosomal protein S18 acetylase RimI-like enzyme